MVDEDTKSHPIDPPLEVNIPGYSEKKHFYTWEELQVFVKDEIAAWEWLNEPNLHRQPPPIGPVSSHQPNTLKGLRPLMDAPSDLKLNRDKISKILSMYQSGKLVCSKSADGQFIIDLSKSDLMAALGALAFLTKENWQLHEQAWRDVLRGTTQLAVSRIDKKGAVERATTALDELRSEWDARFEKEKSALEMLRKELRVEIETTRGEITTAQKRVSKFWINQANDVRRFFRGARSDKDTLEKTFIEHMRLEAPADYWRKKAIAHIIWAIGAFITFAIVSGIAAVMLFGNASLVLALVQPVKDGGFPLGNVAVITLPALAFFWFLRFIARVFVTNLQRHQDARERDTMVQTYLALVKEGENVARPDERILILNALFRPGPGDAPDDSPPAALLDIIKGAQKQ